MKKLTSIRKRNRIASRRAVQNRKLKPIKTTILKAFPPDCNPFRHDLWRMGTDINKRFLVMFDDHSGDSDYVILIEKPTGRRVRITFTQER